MPQDKRGFFVQWLVLRRFCEVRLRGSAQALRNAGKKLQRCGISGRAHLLLRGGLMLWL